jgi:hypothetical protein
MMSHANNLGMKRTTRVLKLRELAVFLLCFLVLNDSAVFGAGIRVDNGDVSISTPGTGIVFPDKSVQVTAAPTGLTTILNGPGDPLVATGVDGDFYVNTISNTLFGPKALGVWPAGFSLVGPPGPVGATGPSGPTGVTGTTGPAGSCYSPPKAPVLNSGQMITYAENDDGHLKTGVGLPTGQRFTDNLNGTITDNMTGLIWVKNPSSCYLAEPWDMALILVQFKVMDGECGLTDGSAVGQWRLPNRNELMSLVDYSTNSPASSNSPALPAGNPFIGVQLAFYWSSSTYAGNIDSAWYVSMFNGHVKYYGKTFRNNIWPVRSGR